MTTEKTRIEEAIESINSKNAKRIAFALVVIFAGYHSLLHLRFGSNSCRWLLSDGRYKGDQEWQPYGCMLHLYTKIDTRRCLRYLAFYEKNSHFVFIGDSRIKELYEAFVQQIQVSDGVYTSEAPKLPKIFTENKLKVKVEYISCQDVSVQMANYFRMWLTEKVPPSVIIAGTALPIIKRSNGSLDTVHEYSMNLTRLVQPIDKLREKNTRVLWAIQVPIYEPKLLTENKMITNSLIDLYNRAAIEILTYSSADIWWSTRLIGEGMIAESLDGIHLTSKPLRHNTQILLNMYCNDYMNFNDGTCCSSAESYTTVQIVTFLSMGACVLAASIMLSVKLFIQWRRKFRHEYTLLLDEQQGGSPNEPLSNTKRIYTLFVSSARISLIMFYFIICDRTNFFMKENKYYSEFSFWLPIGYVTALGLFFTEDSKFTKVLHRDQLNETKGWMLLVLLVYNVTGANRILTINMHVKVILSGYLFLLGYEQFRYVWHRNDVSVNSFFRMMFQLNFMTVVLCLCMNRPYQFYYFVPLWSFWYLMVYCFLALPPHVTAANSESNPMQYYSYLPVKFLCLFSVITVLFLSEVFFEKIFVTRPWKALFVTTDDDIREWWLRWKLDRYTVLYGMGFAVLMLLAQRYNLFDDNNHSNLFSRGMALTATLLAIVGLGCYMTMTFLCRDEPECSEIHSYVVFIPIISYIVLRNISGFLRTRYSSFFAWFGEISLELFVSQYHILLAADTHGVLVLLPGYPVMNVILTSFIFVAASHEFHRLTMILLPYAVPSDWRLVIRNFILFLAILVPIGISDGMF